VKGPRIETREQVMFYDTDAAGVVHNISYLRFIEKNRTLLGSELGLDYKEMAGSGIYGAVLRIEIDYRRPGLLGEDLQVRGWLEEVTKVKFWCGFEIYRAENNELLVSSRQELALVKMPEGKPTRLPADWEKYI
jgi:YbgC/YbaW family acyl-CoA thioester hydrolase|tara:strand:- start:6780 stop:7181 length:402 start_codon:yes stop_codon:yes gene_type:complete